MSDVADEVAQPLMHGCPIADSRGQVVLHAGRDAYIGVLKKLIDDGFTMCSDLTAVDYLTHAGRGLPEGIAPERFEVVVNLTSITTRDRIRIRVQVPESDPVMPTAFNLWPGTEAMEREVFDMFGISFEGHPDLTRILMPEDWEGHPLRKDYEIGHIPVQFKGSHS